MVTLKLCSNCRRHVLAGDATCPFCKSELALEPRGAAYVAAAVAAVAALAVTATTLGCVYGGDPSPGPLDSGADAASTDDAGDDEDSGS